MSDVLSAEVIERLDRPTETARGLPAAAYTSDAFFADEQSHLFPKCWMSIAFSSDLPNVGDAKPLTVCGLPIILVRDTTHTIAAYHNVCRHRATLVLTESAGGLTQFQCPYHAWTYALDGTLKATPFWDGTANSGRCPVDPAQNGLVPVACEVWNNLVFVNLNGQAAPFSDYANLFEQEYADVAFDNLGLVHRCGWEFNANWKLVMENWEVYHHVWVHQGVFDKMSDEVDLVTGVPYTKSMASGNVMMLKTSAERPRADPVTTGLPPLPRAGPGADDLPPIVTAANALLPNTTLTIGPTAYAPAIYLPIAPGITRVEMAWYVAPQAATDAAFASGREALLDRWLGSSREYDDRSGIRSQDHTCMEWQQSARSSPVADDVQFSATWEQDVHYFQRWLVTHLTRD